MKMLFPIALLTTLLLGVANFLFAYFVNQDYTSAMKMTWLQLISCFAITLNYHLYHFHTKND